MRTRTVLCAIAAAAVAAGAVGAGLWQPPNAYAAESPYYDDPQTNAARRAAANPATRGPP
jgi:hypothetical protein